MRSGQIGGAECFQRNELPDGQASNGTIQMEDELVLEGDIE